MKSVRERSLEAKLAMLASRAKNVACSCELAVVAEQLNKLYGLRSYEAFRTLYKATFERATNTDQLVLLRMLATQWRAEETYKVMLELQ